MDLHGMATVTRQPRGKQPALECWIFGAESTRNHTANLLDTQCEKLGCRITVYSSGINAVRAVISKCGSASGQKPQDAENLPKSSRLFCNLFCHAERCVAQVDTKMGLGWYWNVLNPFHKLL